jgi:hypothetical protein
MKRAIVKLKSVSRYSQSASIQSPKKERETPEAYEERTWRERCHATADTGNIFIPPMAFANSLKDAAKYLSIPIKQQQTYTKNFESGVMVLDPVVLPQKRDEVLGETIFVPSNGKQGGGTRVWKTFPYVDSWSGTVEYIIVDDIITESVFTRVLIASGTLIGIGRFRPRNRGYYGRFKVESVAWQHEEL